MEQIEEQAGPQQSFVKDPNELFATGATPEEFDIADTTYRALYTADALADPQVSEGPQAVDTYSKDSIKYNNMANEVQRKQILVKSTAKTIEIMEGGVKQTGKLHKPTDGSGWTLATGVDFAFLDEHKAKAANIPQRFIDFAKKNKLFGTTKASFKGAQPEPLTQEEYDKIVEGTSNRISKEVYSLVGTDNELSLKGASVLGAMMHWKPEMLKDVPSMALKDSNTAFRKATELGVEKGESREYVNLIGDMLKRGKMSDDELVAALEMIAYSYKTDRKGKDRSARLNTVLKYASFLRGEEYTPGNYKPKFDNRLKEIKYVTSATK